MSDWTQLGTDIRGEAAGDESGYSISLSNDGTILAIGAKKNDGNGSDSGHVRVYEWNGSAWVQKGSDIDGEAGGDNAGYSVSLSSDGSILAIGAIYNDGNGSYNGHVRVYEWNESGWIQKGSDIDGEVVNDYSGWSVSLSNDGYILAIGAPYNDGNGSNSGHVRVYEWNESGWIQKGSNIDGEAAGDQSGYSVSLSSDGSILAIGAILNDSNGSNSGHVRVYEWNESGWIQKGSDIDGEAGNDRSGYSVSLSDDGTILAIGAIYNNGNGSSSGHVRVYEWNGSAWVQKGSDIDGEAGGDNAGYSVSLSSDGSILAIGATSNDSNGSNSGHVRVFELPPSPPPEDVPPPPASETITNTGADISVDGNIIVSSGGTVEGNDLLGFTNLSSITDWFTNNTPTYFDDTTGISETLTVGNTVYYATDISSDVSFNITVNGETITYNIENEFPLPYNFTDSNEDLIEIRPVFKGSGGLEIQNTGPTPPPDNGGIGGDPYITTKNGDVLKLPDENLAYQALHFENEKYYFNVNFDTEIIDDKDRYFIEIMKYFRKNVIDSRMMMKVFKEVQNNTISFIRHIKIDYINKRTGEEKCDIYDLWDERLMERKFEIAPMKLAHYEGVKSFVFKHYYDFNGKKLELNLILFPNPQIKTGFKFKLPKNLSKEFTGLLTNTEEFNNHFIDNIESTTPMTKDISIVPVYEEYNDGNKSFIRKINQLRLK
jgi:hypothetical protein